MEGSPLINKNMIPNKILTLLNRRFEESSLFLHGQRANDDFVFRNIFLIIGNENQI